jgi:rfaE bifunctional protein kinase chain/domain
MNFKLTDRYKHKIKTPLEIKEIIGEIPRDRKVIMCHGVFDIVHPGHIRHLMYAKGKAPILVASITADHFINKGTYRPHVPQDLRAVNLAAFEIVDYVVIDEFQTPINNLKIIQPDLFAKGYEYSPNVESFAKTKEEIQVVREYGGEVIFTPGDIVYSSSNLINLSPPELKIEKLMMLMSRNSITFDDLNDALDKFKEFNVHVIGDTIIDSYTNCEMIGGQTKTPTMSVKFESKKDVLGGAGIVAEHLKAAGASAKLTSVVGNDDLGKFTIAKIKESGIKSQIIVDKNRPTTNKNAVIVGSYRLLKIDNLDNSSISDEILSKVVSSITETKSDAIIFSDFRHGIFNKRTINPLINSIPSGVFKVADSQIASRWGNILDFKGFDLITPNEREARFALADQDSGIRPLASQLYDNCDAGLLILKLGERGILTCLNSNHESLDSFIVMDSFAQHVVDPVGAGDALIAYSTLAMLSTSDPIIASIIGNIAAGCECEHDGNIPISVREVKSKLNSIQKIIESNT